MKRPKPKRRPNPRRAKRRPNPLKTMLPPEKAPVFQDPIFLHYVASAILRFLELQHPAEIAIMRAMETGKIDAEFPRPDSGQCRHCGKTPAQAYEDSMGMCCVKNSDTFMHEFTKEESPE